VTSDISVILSTGQENVDATCTNKQKSKVLIFRDVINCSNAIVLDETAASVFKVEGGVKSQKTDIDYTLRTSDVRSRNLLMLISYYCVSKQINYLYIERITTLSYSFSCFKSHIMSFLVL